MSETIFENVQTTILFLNFKMGGPSDIRHLQHRVNYINLFKTQL